MDEPNPTEPNISPARIAPATPASIARAGALIREGRLVAFPTETVYGLGGDATQDRAVAAIFAAKGRPSFNPLIVHVPDLAQAADIGRFDAVAEEVAARYWPGPLTLILPRTPGSPVSRLATAGLDTVAVRVPSHPVAQALLAAARRPIAAPSANRSGRISATAPVHVAEELAGRVELVLAAGRTPVGVESTILDLTGERPALLRPGAIGIAELTELLPDLAMGDGDPDRPNAPGQLRRHYAPGTPIRLDALAAEPGEALLAFGPDPFAGRQAAAVLNLSETGDLHEAAANLFAMLRTLDAAGHRRIAVMPIPERGLGVAINDRLRRAAVPEGADE